MEIARSALRELPAQFEIKDGELVAPFAPPEHGPHEKIVDGKVVPKTLAEKVADGLIKLEPDQKAVGERIVEKSMAEKVADGLVKLAPDEKLEGESIVKKTAAEQLKEGLITLADVKKGRIQQFSLMSLALRAAILPDHKLQNAALGIYDEETVAGIKRTVEEFRNEFHRLERLITEAKDLAAVEAVRPQFPGAPPARETGQRPKAPEKKRN